MIWLLKRRRSGYGWAAVSLFALCSITVILEAANKLPAAGAILDRYVDVTGGSALWHSRNFETDDLEGRSLDDNNVVLRARISFNRSGDSLSEVQVPVRGTEGVYKGTAWAVSSFSGVRIKHGAERAESIRDARMLEEADWRRLYPKARVLGIEGVGGKRCYRVSMSPVLSEWFDVATGLLVRRETSELTSSGTIPVGYTVEQWANRGGLKQPSLMLAWRGDFQYRLTVLTALYNEPRTLEYPAEVAEYLGGKELPNAEEIIERHIYVTGGEEGYAKLKTQRISGALTFLSSNLRAQVETWAAEGGRYYQSVDMPGLGKQEEGSDGLVTWERSPVMGPKVRARSGMDGLGVTMDAAQVIGWRYQLSAVRTEGVETLDGRECYRVHLVPRGGGAPLLRWYERETGLLYRAATPLATSMGSLPVMMTFEEYTEASGIKWPSRIRMVTSGQDLLFTTSEVKLNDPVDLAVFDLPAEIHTLAEKQAAAIL